METGLNLLAEADTVADIYIAKVNANKKEREPTRRYRLLNEKWPANIPPMTDRDVKFAARVLWRLVMGKKFTGQLVVKHRGRSWARSHQIIGNSRQGWHDVVHDWSHDMHRKLYPNETSHGPHQAPIERRMVEEVVKRGWLTGRLNKPVVEKPKPDVKGERYQRGLKSIAAWETKAKRAETALKKLRRKKTYYER